MTRESLHHVILCPIACMVDDPLAAFVREALCRLDNAMITMLFELEASLAWCDQGSAQIIRA